jgi:uncharacterized phage-associated protein
MVRFQFNESKALEALVYIAERWPGITPFYVAKVLFFADKDHLQKYGRPVLGDVFIAMDNGPVPSQIYDMLKGKLDFFADPSAIRAGLRIDKNGNYPKAFHRRAPDTDQFSETDIQAIDDAIKFCEGKSFAYLSNLTHKEEAWASAPRDGAMSMELVVPEDMREEVRENAAYSVF